MVTDAAGSGPTSPASAVKGCQAFTTSPGTHWLTPPHTARTNIASAVTSTAQNRCCRGRAPGITTWEGARLRLVPLYIHSGTVLRGFRSSSLGGRTQPGSHRGSCICTLRSRPRPLQPLLCSPGATYTPRGEVQIWSVRAAVRPQLTEQQARQPLISTGSSGR